MAASIYDTQDLGATQGASLALLNAPEAVRVASKVPLETVFIGASQGLFRFEGDADTARSVAEAARQTLSNSVFAHLSFVVDVEAVGPDESTARQRVLSRNRVRQMRSLGPALPAPVQGAKGYCPVDRVRPGALPDRESAPVSASVKMRRDYRRVNRDGFYQTLIGLGDIRPHKAEDFDAILGKPLSRPKRESIRNKMAVVYFDGNRFGAVRKAVGDETFSRTVSALRRDLMAAILSPDSAYWAAPARAGWHRHFFEDGRTTLETILWGGDEMMWVVPAWLAWPLLTAFFDQTEGWNVEGHPLTHAGGVVMCDRKTPIRQVKALAGDLADIAKGDRTRSAVQIEVLESIDIPEGYLARQRERLFGPRLPPDSFTIHADEWTGMTRRLCRSRARFPRSQLYGLLHRARACGALTDPTTAAVQPLIDGLEEVLKAGQYGCSLEDLVGERTDTGSAYDVRLLRLARLATLWDYVDPFDLGEAES
jgi:hypothetical protein